MICATADGDKVGGLNEVACMFRVGPRGPRKEEAPALAPPGLRVPYLGEPVMGGNPSRSDRKAN
jgi:hypothetical protein